MTGRDRIYAVGLMALVALLFSTGGAAIKATSLGAWEVACGRSLVAALVIASLSPSARRSWTPSVLWVGAAYAATLTLFVHANKLTTASHAVFLQATAPFYVVILSPWLLAERWRGRDLAVGSIWVLALALLAVGSGPPSYTAPSPTLGGILAAVSAVTYALLVIGLRRSERRSTTSSSGAAAVVAGNLLAVAVCLPFAWMSVDQRPTAWVSTSAVDWGIVIYLGAFQVGLAYLLMLRAVRSLRAVQVSLLLLIEPLASPLWAYLWHDERPSVWASVGGLLALVATALAAIGAARAAERSPSEGAM